MTEFGFLLDLLLNHKLPKATKEALIDRIKEVEGRLTQSVMMVPRGSGITPAQISTVPPHLVGQAPSTIAAMMRHPDLVAQIAPAEPAPVAVIAQTPAAQAAMNARQETINQAMSGKPDKGRTSPRKF